MPRHGLRPGMGTRHVLRTDQAQQPVHVVEGIVARIRRLRVPAVQQLLPARAHINAQQVQPPQQRRRVQPLQCDVGRVGTQVLVKQLQRALMVQRLQRKQGLVPTQVAREAVALRPVRLPVRHPRNTFINAALHLHHMGHGMNGPGHLGGAVQGVAAGVFGLGVQVALFQTKGVQAQHIRVQRVGRVPFGQHARHALAQLGGVTAVKVEQVGPLQCQRVARVVQQQGFPGAAGAMPVAGRQPPQRMQVAALARAGLCIGMGCKDIGLVEQRHGVFHQRRLGQAEQEAGLHQQRQQPMRVGLCGGVQVFHRRAVERHHSPQRTLGGGHRVCRCCADGVAARVVHGPGFGEEDRRE